MPDQSLAYLESVVKRRPLTRSESEQLLVFRKEQRRKAIEDAYKERKAGDVKEVSSPIFPSRFAPEAETETPEPTPESAATVEPPACPECGTPYPNANRRMCYVCNGAKIRGNRAARALRVDPAPPEPPRAPVAFRPLRPGDAAIQSRIDDLYQVAEALNLAKNMSPRALGLFRAELAELPTS